MPMLEGLVVINPLTGAVTTATGAAGEVFNIMNTGQDYGTATGVTLYQARERVAVLARAVAKIIPHIQVNAVVSTTVSTTVAPLIPVTVVPATGVGTTTGPGTGSGSGTGTVA